MKKQIIYSTLIPRLFATTIDLVSISIILPVIMHFASPKLFAVLFYDAAMEHNIDTTNIAAIESALRNVPFIESVGVKKVMSYFLIVTLINISAIAAFFVGFWAKFGSTPGKMLMRLKIVDAQTFGNPSIYQLLKRFILYPTGLFGIALVPFSKQKQALHDKAAGTVIIKS